MDSVANKQRFLIANVFARSDKAICRFAAGQDKNSVEVVLTRNELIRTLGLSLVISLFSNSRFLTRLCRPILGPTFKTQG